MKSVVIERPNEIALVMREIPEPGPGELMIQVMASGICGCASMARGAESPGTG